MTLFELAATLSLDTTNFNRSIRQASDTGQNFANTLSQNVTAKAVALGNALYKAAETGARALINLGKSAVTAAAEVSAENAQFEAAFGDIQKAANNVFNAIGRDTNILATRLRGVGTKAFSQFKGAGLEAADALAMTDKYTRIAADAAAYYDITLEEADEKLRSFLRGNTEAGDAIGLFTSESQRNTYAMEQYGKKWLDLTEAQRQMLMLNVAEDIYRQNGALGQAAEEAYNWLNVWSNFQTRIKEVLADLGTPFVDALTPFVQNITDKLADETFLTNLETLATKLGEIAGISLTEVSSALDTLLTGEVDENSSLSRFVGSLQKLSDWVRENRTVVEAFFGSLLIALAAVNFPLAVMIGCIALLILNWEGITKAVDAAIEAVKNFFETKVAPVWQSIVEGVVSTWNNVAGAIRKAISNMKEFFGLSDKSKPVKITGLTGEITPEVQNALIMSGEFVGPPLPPGKAVGMDYVPYDNYVARLHEGEAVLTKAEATSWRRGEGQGVDVAGIVGAVVQGVREGLRGLAINMDGHAVGDLVTEQVSRNIAQAAWAGRYSG